MTLQITFTVRPSDFATAMSAGASTIQEAATQLVAAYVDKQLQEILARVKEGKPFCNPMAIRVDKSVSHHSSSHKGAVQDVAAALRTSGYQASAKTVPEQEDGPNRSSPAYDVIEITL